MDLQNSTIYISSWLLHACQWLAWDISLALLDSEKSRCFTGISQFVTPEFWNTCSSDFPGPCSTLIYVWSVCGWKWVPKLVNVWSLCRGKAWNLARGLIHFGSVNGQSVARSDPTCVHSWLLTRASNLSINHLNHWPPQTRPPVGVPLVSVSPQHIPISMNYLPSVEFSRLQLDFASWSLRLFSLLVRFANLCCTKARLSLNQQLLRFSPETHYQTALNIIPTTALISRICFWLKLHVQSFMWTDLEHVHVWSVLQMEMGLKG